LAGVRREKRFAIAQQIRRAQRSRPTNVSQSGLCPRYPRNVAP
jgi:hypothetical protein